MNPLSLNELLGRYNNMKLKFEALMKGERQDLLKWGIGTF
jgi:hypothetical protein